MEVNVNLVENKLDLSENAVKVLERRYLKGIKTGIVLRLLQICLKE
jgi:hypothetical protein